MQVWKIASHRFCWIDVTPCQGRHDAPKYYGTNGDILNFAIYQTSGASVLRMFSVSRIHGALGDNGQNYKSLSFLAEKIQIQSSSAMQMWKRYGHKTS